MKENAAAKGRRYLTEGRLVLSVVAVSHVEGQCRGDGDVYRFAVRQRCMGLFLCRTWALRPCHRRPARYRPDTEAPVSDYFVLPGAQGRNTYDRRADMWPAHCARERCRRRVRSSMRRRLEEARRGTA